MTYQVTVRWVYGSVSVWLILIGTEINCRETMYGI